MHGSQAVRSAASLVLSLLLSVPAAHLAAAAHDAGTSGAGFSAARCAPSGSDAVLSAAKADSHSRAGCVGAPERTPRPPALGRITLRPAPASRGPGLVLGRSPAGARPPPRA